MFNWITDYLATAGLFGITFLMFAENVFPQIPFELIMPIAGFNAAQGGGSLLGAVLAGTTESLADVSVWY